jgi:hypothetical protein
MTAMSWTPVLALMTTDCLPCELPLEASEAFSAALAPFVGAMARANYRADDVDPSLPQPIREAVVVWSGRLTPAYRYMEGGAGLGVPPT